MAPPDAKLRPKKPVLWREVCNHPLVLPVPGHGLRALIDQGRTGLEADIAVETNSLSAQTMLVVEGHGWTVLPASGVAQDIAAGILSGAPVCEPEVSRQLVLGLPRTPPAVEAVAAALLRQVDGLVRSKRWPSARALDCQAYLPGSSSPAGDP